MRQTTVIFPELFDEFEVIPIHSSEKRRNPLQVDPQPAAKIVQNARGLVPSEREKYCKMAEELQHTFDLDKEIAKRWTGTNLKPHVHAEILVLNYIEHSGGSASHRFFRNWKCIGCSKPSCRLCFYYFMAHPSGVRVRTTHGNIYPSWRLPDQPDTLHGLEERLEDVQRQDILQRITTDVQTEILRVLRERLPGNRHWDSATLSSLAANLRGGFALDSAGLREQPTSDENGPDEDRADV